MSELGHIPASIVAGESIWIATANTGQASADITIDGYTPAAGYTLAYQFAATTPVSVAAVANNDQTGWTLDVSGAVTLTWGPGRVAFAGIVTHTATQRSAAIDSGGIMVTASPMRVSQWQAVVAAIDAAMLTVAAQPHGSISIGGMSASYRSADDLTRLRDYAVGRLRADTGLRMPSRILSRFT